VCALEDAHHADLLAGKSETQERKLAIARNRHAELTHVPQVSSKNWNIVLLVISISVNTAPNEVMVVGVKVPGMKRLRYEICCRFP